MADEVIDGTAVETAPDEPGPQAPGSRSPAPGSELAAVSGHQKLAVTPEVTADELVSRLDVIREAASRAMTEGVDYGTIPGTDKPALYKPGSEKLGVLFQLDVQVHNEKVWGPGDHLTVLSHATVFHAPTGARLGYGEGACSTREKKYAVRKQERKCPSCGAAAVIKGKEEYGGGWLCWKKRDGCGAKFNDGDPSIENQEAGEVPNPDLPDLWNTVVKMAQKRARVDAVLAVTGASALFTQDIDEQGGEPPEQKLPFGEAASAELETKLAAALHTLVGPEKITVAAEKLEADSGGYLPRIVARAVALVAATRVEAMGDTIREKEQEVRGSSDSSTEDGHGSGAEGAEAPAGAAASAGPDA
jgi:hypothetical protein